MPYASLSDFDRFLEEFGTNYYGINDNGTLSIGTTVWQNDIDASFNKINSLLSSIQRIPYVPIGTQKNGSYHSALIEWNCCDVIYTKLRSRHMTEYNDALPKWMLNFNERGNQIYSEINDQKILFDTDTPNKGIGIPSVIRKSGLATLYSNWDSGFYSASDYEKAYRIKVSNVSEGSTVGCAKYKVSEDDGVSYNDTEIYTGTCWNEIKHGLKIRFASGLGTLGTFGQLELNDEWRIHCTPMNVKRSGGKARSKSFEIG